MVSFRKGPRNTGLAAIANPFNATDIKHNRKKIGIISPPSRFGSDYWIIRIAVKRAPELVTKESPCEWKWIGIKTDGVNRYTTEDEARVAVNRVFPAIEKNYQLHYFED